MTTCPDCSQAISDVAPTCPHCGRPNTATPVVVVPPKGGGCADSAIKGFLILCLLLALGVGGCFVLVVGLGSTKAPRPSATPTRVVLKGALCTFGGFGSVALWRLTIENQSANESFSDLRYRTEYVAESGKVLRTNRGTLNITLKPGETRLIEEFSDGFIPKQVTGCRFELVSR